MGISFTQLWICLIIKLVRYNTTEKRPTNWMQGRAACCELMKKTWSFQLLFLNLNLFLLCCFCWEAAKSPLQSVPFVHQQLTWGNGGNILKKGGVKFANINLVSNWTTKFRLNELPLKCSGPWLHAFNPEVNLIWSREPYTKGTALWLIKPSKKRPG